MKNTVNTLAITLIAFSVYFLLNKLFSPEIYQQITALLQVKTLRFFLTYLIVGLPLLLGLLLLHPAKFIWESLALKASVVRGMAVAFLFTLPMLIGFAWVFKFKRERDFHWP